MYIRDALKFKICQKQHRLTSLEALWIKIDNLIEHPTAIGVVYRHRNSSTIVEFIKNLSCCIIEFHTKKYFIHLETLISIYHRKMRPYRPNDTYVDQFLLLSLITIPTKVSKDTRFVLL